MRRLTVILSTMLLLPGAAMAVDHGHFGISGDAKAWPSNYLAGTFDSRYWEPNTMIGFRFYVDRTLSLDLRLGFETVSAVDYDSASGTDSEPAYGSIALEGGAMFRFLETERSYVGWLGRFGLTFNKFYRYISDPAAPWEHYKYEEYYVTTVNLFLGVEPTYFFNEHFSIYSTFGMRIKMIPATKYVEYPEDWDHDDYVAGNYELKDRKNSLTVIASDGIWIGVRYCP